MKTTILKLMVMAMALTLSISSCKKEDNDFEMGTSEDNSAFELSFDEIYKEVDAAASEQGLKKAGFPLITIDSSVTPYKMTIDYGITNYLCKDGNLRRGKIFVTWTGFYRAKGTKIEISFDNFYQNNKSIKGQKTIENLGRNTNGKLHYEINVNANITGTDGLTHYWKSKRTRTWLEGESTLTSLDDIYEITGNAEGTSRKGISYTVSIISPLRVDLSCEWRIVKGIITLTPAGNPERKLDFGNGSCSSEVTLTVNGRSKTFNRTK
jgi:hypothetical protein